LSPARDADDVAIQRFSLVSRGAPRVRRLQAQRSLLVPPPALINTLGPSIRVCRCSECLPSKAREENAGGLTSSGERLRLCRQDTDKHPEYKLLLDMSARFREERNGNDNGSELASEACCRQKTAYFILGGECGRNVIGYIAAETAANRRVGTRLMSLERPVATGMQVCGAQDADEVPILLQVWLEPEYRSSGLATSALRHMLHGHSELLVDNPSAAVVRALSRLGLRVAGCRRGGLPRRSLTAFCNKGQDQALDFGVRVGSLGGA